MTYEEFKNAVITEVKRKVGEEVNVVIHKVPKNNGIVLDGITLMRKGSYMAPTFYLQDFYCGYKKGIDLENVVEQLIGYSLEHPVQDFLPDNFFIEYESVKERICFKLIHYEKNMELLKEVPYKRFLDLAMVYYCIAKEDFLSQATILIRNTDLERWEISEENLFDAAVRNTPKILPWRFASVQTIVDEFLSEGGEEAISMIESACDITRASMEHVEMYILTNKNRYFGAACMLYPDLLSQIADRFDMDLYILPSSIHECIIMPKTPKYTKEELCSMVQDINEREVDDLDILSDCVYTYNRILNEVQL